MNFLKSVFIFCHSLNSTSIQIQSDKLISWTSTHSTHPPTPPPLKLLRHFQTTQERIHGFALKVFFANHLMYKLQNAQVVLQSSIQHIKETETSKGLELKYVYGTVCLCVTIQGKVFQHQKLLSSNSSILLGKLANVKKHWVQLKKIKKKSAKAP